MMPKTRSRGKKIADLVCFIVFAALCAFIVCLVAMPTWRPAAFGYRGFTVASGSMGKAAPQWSLIWDKVVKDPSELKEGDIITFRNDQKIFVTHRIVAIKTDANGVTVYQVKGDMNSAPDAYNPKFSDIYGRFDGAKINGVGIVTAFLASAMGMICVLLLLVIWLFFDFGMDVLRKAEAGQVQYSGSPWSEAAGADNGGGENGDNSANNSKSVNESLAGDSSGQGDNIENNQDNIDSDGETALDTEEGNTAPEAFLIGGNPDEASGEPLTEEEADEAASEGTDEDLSEEDGSAAEADYAEADGMSAQTEADGTPGGMNGTGGPDEADKEAGARIALMKAEQRREAAAEARRRRKELLASMSDDEKATLEKLKQRRANLNRQIAEFEKGIAATRE